MSDFIKSNFSIPKSTRVAFAPRTSKYRDELAALTAGTDEALLAQVSSKEDADKAKQRFSSAVSQYRKATGDADGFAIRAFTVVDGAPVGFNPEKGDSYVGVWRTGPKPVKAKKGAPADNGADEAAQA